MQGPLVSAQLAAAFIHRRRWCTREQVALLVAAVWVLETTALQSLDSLDAMISIRSRGND